MKIQIDLNELNKMLDNCVKDTEELIKMIEEYNEKYPFIKLTTNINIDYEKAMKCIKFELIK